jgi:DNA invertase Pin-like site-specific DNA recombinase
VERSAKLKGFCRNCYQKNYWYTKHGGKPRIKTDYNKVDYNLVLNLVENGLTITDACKTSKIERSTFYRAITEQQKLELIAYKSIGPSFINYDLND